MPEGIYQLIIVIVGLFALFKGYRRGFLNQLSGLLGMAFGVTCSIVFADRVAEILKSVIATDFPFPSYFYSTLASAIIYVSVFVIIRFFTNILKSAMSIFHVGILNRIAGAGFCLFKYLMVLSIIYNLIVCFDSKSSLLKYTQYDDGNIVAGVLNLAPNVLGSVDIDDLTHALQLIDAKKISCNFNSEKDVIKIEKPFSSLNKIDGQC